MLKNLSLQEKPRIQMLIPGSSSSSSSSGMPAFHPPQTEVSIPNRAGLKLGVAWQRGNALTLFPTAFPKQERSQGLGAPMPLTLVSWERSLYQPIFRKLVNESAQTFLQLQKAMNTPEESK
eukprot:maker-scaffold77_size404793-snap-gene-3.28 protein:Tk04787 transcript:maker-scaffold77_size404793-snap-gene-3.28-mRNA-1 annotation:"GI24644"